MHLNCKKWVTMNYKFRRPKIRITKIWGTKSISFKKNQSLPIHSFLFYPIFYFYFWFWTSFMVYRYLRKCFGHACLRFFLCITAIIWSLHYQPMKNINIIGDRKINILTNNVTMIITLMVLSVMMDVLNFFWA